LQNLFGGQKKSADCGGGIGLQKQPSMISNTGGSDKALI